MEVFQQCKAKTSLIKELQNLFDTGNNSDIVFVIGDEEIYAHTFILCFRSPWMERKLYRKPTRKRVHNIDAPEFKSFLNFLYTDDCHINGFNVEVLLRLGDTFEVPMLVEKCINFISNQLNETNILRYAELGLSRTCAYPLLMKCLKFLPDLLIDVNFVYLNAKGNCVPISYALVWYIVKYCERCPDLEDLLFRRVIAWAKNQCGYGKAGIEPSPTIKDVLKGIIKHIKFEYLEPWTLATLVRQNNLLSNKKLLDLFCNFFIDDEKNTTET